MSDIKETETGIELDALEIPPASHSPATDPSDSTSPPPEEPANETKEVEPKTLSEKKPKKVRLSAVIITISLIALVSVSLILWNKEGTRSASVTDQRPPGPAVDMKASIGPIITNAGEAGDIIRMTIEITCMNSESKKMISEMTSLIKSRIVMSMSSRRAGNMAKIKDLKSLESYLVDEIKDAVKGISIEEIRVYFSESIAE
jgi:flagellar basal body-associated protein FliL